jgi:two-component system, response regulator
MQPKAILLVEDNSDHEALTLRALRRSNITSEILVARDGSEALEYLHGSRDGKPNLGVVLLDLKLPQMDGIEVLRRIRADTRTAALPVVVLTSSDEERDMSESYRNGANSYVLKPVAYDQFVDVARQLGLYWLKLNQAPAGG